jgi:hypothetical protein
MLMDCQTRLAEKETDLKIAQTQAEVDKEGIQKQYEVEKMKAENDAARVVVESRYADAAMVSAQASATKADSYVIKAEAQAEEARYNSAYQYSQGW